MGNRADRTQRDFVLIAAVFGLLAVAAGAFAVHGLEKSVALERLEVFKTAVQYQMYHALALLAAACLSKRWGGRLIAVAGWLFVAGTVVFSGSLYLLVLTDTPLLGVITPIGGIGFLAGWTVLALAAINVGRG